MTIKMFMSHFYEKVSIKILTLMNTYEKYKKFKWLNKYLMFSYKEKKKLKSMFIIYIYYTHISFE